MRAPTTTELVLREGQLVISGRVMPASNVTYFAEVTYEGSIERCVYKPVSGERPLWDFPDGTLAFREVAAYAVSSALGWDVVPLTLLRQSGPAGPGMVQVWCEPDPARQPVDLFPRDQVPRDFVRVLDAYDAHDRPIALAHEDCDALRRMAVFDAIVNNADRKGGHVLPMPGGHCYGVDHGVCFNVDPKLRTVLWGWARQRIPAPMRDAVERVGQDPDLLACLAELLAAEEVDAFRRRCSRLVATGRMPVPSGEWPAIPWPAF